MQTYILDTDYNPHRDDVRIIRNGIIHFNDTALHHASQSLAIFLRDETSHIQGGLLAWLDVDSIYIDLLWIDETLRNQGYGSKLLTAVENEGIKKGFRYCTVDTFGFQAEDFYLKNGYEQIGEIKNYIRGYSRLFFRKWLKE